MKKISTIFIEAFFEVKSKVFPIHSLLIIINDYFWHMINPMTNIFNLFGPSPIKPLEQHMRKVYHCARQLIPFFEAVLKRAWEEAAAIKRKIDELEKEADGIKRELRLHLPTGLFLPVARSDLLELLNVQDKIANCAQDIAGLTLSRKMVPPVELHSLFMPFLHHCLDAAHQACQAINELDELLESGFRGNELKIVENMILKLDKIEHDCDTMLAGIHHKIFEMESTLPAIDVIFLYKLVQWIGYLADHAQTVGGRLQILIAR